ncbi:hypothetical protein GCM10009563_23320 [Subtercola frigoramans]
MVGFARLPPGFVRVNVTTGVEVPDAARAAEDAEEFEGADDMDGTDVGGTEAFIDRLLIRASFRGSALQRVRVARGRCTFIDMATKVWGNLY